MSELSSCYFCGTALDAPVERYPLTPPHVDAETGRSVALCPTCRRKLVRVLEVVAGEFDAVSEADAAVAAAEPNAAEAETETSASGEAAEPDTADAERTAPEPTASDGEDGDEGEAVASEGGADGAGADGESGTDDGADRVEAAEGGQVGDAVAESSDTPEADTDETAGQRAGDGGAAADDAAAEPVGDDATAEPVDEGAAAGGGKPDLLSTPAAQKVIKLLQNREFPLDREEFEVVASNAYDIPMGDCRDVIDTLVAEGYVAEDGGQLVRPE